MTEHEQLSRAAPPPPGGGPTQVINKEFVRLFLSFHFFMLSVSTFNLLPHYLALRGASQTLYGAVAGTAGWTNVLFGLLLGHLADRWSRKATVAFYLMVGLAGNLVALLAMSHAIEWFFLARALQGMAMGLGMPIVFAWTMEVSPRGKRKEGLAWLGIAGLSANSLGPLGAETILSFQPQPVRPESYFAVFLAAVALQVVSLGILALVTNRRADGGEPGEPVGLLRILMRPASAPVLLISICFGGVFGVLMSFGKNYVASMGLAYASVLFSAYSGGAIISRVFITPLTAYLTTRHMIPFGLAGIAVSQFMLSRADTYWLLASSGLVYGLSHGILYPTLFVRYLESQRPSEMGRGSILFHGSFSAGWGIFPFVGGWLTEWIGFSALFLLLGGMAGAAILLHLLAERMRPSGLIRQ